MQATEDRRARQTPLHHDPEALSWAREAKGVTKTWLAGRADISVGHMSDIESGRRNAPPALLKRIAAALNCPVTVLERKREASVS